MKALVFRHSLAREAASAPAAGWTGAVAHVAQGDRHGRGAGPLSVWLGRQRHHRSVPITAFPYPERARPAVYGRKR